MPTETEPRELFHCSHVATNKHRIVCHITKSWFCCKTTLYHSNKLMLWCVCNMV